MPSYERVDLSPDEAAGRLRKELTQASDLLETGRVEKALDCYVAALGLALQLGPAATQQVLASSLDGARRLAYLGDAGALCAMGPALVDLVSQVIRAGVLDSTPVGHAWATVARDIGSLIGQLGLTLSLPPGNRDGMTENARVRAMLLDDATGGVFQLAEWLETVDRAAAAGGASPPGI